MPTVMQDLISLKAFPCEKPSRFLCIYNPTEMEDKSKNILMKIVGTIEVAEIPAK